MNTTFIVIVTAIVTSSLVWGVWHKAYNGITFHESRLCRRIAIWWNIGAVALLSIFYYASGNNIERLLDWANLLGDYFLPMVFTFCIMTVVTTIIYFVVRLIKVSRIVRRERQERMEIIRRVRDHCM